MVDQPEVPGPGELVGPDNIDAEAQTGPIPDGEILDIDPVLDHRRSTLELPQVVLTEAESAFETREREIRRTGTDRDDLRAIRARLDTEERLDHTASNDEREVTLDPAQDESGPQSDQS